jgi:hypothetical protein
MPIEDATKGWQVLKALLSGVMNFVGVLIGGIAVAYALVEHCIRCVSNRYGGDSNE